MEYLDIYDENGTYLGQEDRNIVHRDALWHNTVHCWLYDKKGNIYFQIRKDEKKLYTTASGHIQAGESIKQGFGREIQEEIGIFVETDKATLIDVHTYQMDLTKKNGTLFRDRAFVNLYAYDFEGNIADFAFDENEIDGLVKINAHDTMQLFHKELPEIHGCMIKKEGNQNIEMHKTITEEDFLLCNGENLIGKYGTVLNKVIELTQD